MKRVLTLASVCLLTGCGANHVIPGDNGKPLSITESGYSSSGCIENLQAQATKFDVKLKNITVQNSALDNGIMIVTYGIVKGVTCSADCF